MNVDTVCVRSCLQSFDFKNLFIQELNWTHCAARPLDLELDGSKTRISPIAEMGGMVVYHVELLSSDELPPSFLRRQIETKVKQLTHEHIIIFTDKRRSKSVWQWVRRGGGQTTATREYSFYKGQLGDTLLQKLDGIAFDIEDFDSQGKIAVIKVLEKVTRAFDVEKVTKKFYDEFKAEHAIFCKFLKGLENQDELAWYASVMLNRLMFIYFIQKKGFLGGDTDYLANRLTEAKYKGLDQFYRHFLMPLFFEGFAKEEKDRSSEINNLLGKVPYLNGGLFLPHQLEQAHGEAISIKDSCFERLFDFFDKYNWHLDYRPLRAGNEINPDVLGYIFEKYINQKQMGAYYTKEDITGYICRNTIIPFLFDKLENMRYDELHPFPMKDVEPYIYDAVKQKEYLPTETEREYQVRNKRYQQIKDDFAVGKITTINDLITYNLDIRKFSEDLVASIKDPLTLRAFYFHCLTKVTVLDPAVGSGAFLFAALNLLESLYEICLDKMEELGGPKYPEFAEELKRIDQHPNRQYFILKSIIVNNLFGTDIMEEAVEICKLRLFLKLVAQVNDMNKIEPLPDIDFNIRSGNTLVGYINLEQIRAVSKAGAAQAKMDIGGEIERIDRSAQAVDRDFQNFRTLQTKMGIDSRVLAKAKLGLKLDLGRLQDELNHYLAGEYGINSNRPAAYEKWLMTHQPFHWFVEFYGIMRDGGFDVIIGNPPYVEYSKIRHAYSIKYYATESCGNTYAFFTERSITLLRKSGRFGMIVQLPVVCTDRMKPLQETCIKNSNAIWFATFDDRPARLFDGLEHIRACIFTFEKGTPTERMVYSTAYNRWYSELRDTLFSLLSFQDCTNLLVDGSIPKIGDQVAKSICQYLNSFSPLGKELRANTPYSIYFHNAPQYWIRSMNFIPYFWNEQGGEQVSSHIKQLYTVDKKEATIIVAILNSSFFYWWFIIFSNCRDLVMREIERFPLGFDQMLTPTKQKLTELSALLMNDLKTNSQRKEAYYKTTGKVIYDEFYPKYSKPIIDEIDRVLAKHYGFSEKELDYIINYDIKYRMGKGDGEEDDP